MKIDLKLLLQKTSFKISVIFIITSLCYFNTLFNDYNFDDELVIKNEFVLKGFRGIAEIWRNPYSVIDGINVDYRPLTLTLFALEYALIGFNPSVDHFLNLLTYLLCLYLLFQVCRHVFETDKIHPTITFIIVLLYAVHPSHTEVVSSIKNRDEIMSFIWILLATLSFNKTFQVVKKPETVLYLLLTILFVYLSILTKSISLPFMACVFLWSLYKKLYRKSVPFLVLLIGMTAVILLHIYTLQHFYSRNIAFIENPLVQNTSLEMTLGLGLNTFLFYCKFLIYSFPFRFFYGYNIIPIESFTNPLPLLSLCISIGLISLLIYSILKKKNYSYFLFSFLFCILFYSNLFIPYTGIVSERAMFQFSFFFISFVLIHSYEFINSNKSTLVLKKKLAIGLLYVFIFSFSFLTIKRNFDWKDTLTLLFKDIPYLKESSGANVIIANNCIEKSIQLQKEDTAQSKKWAELAIFYYKEAIQITPNLKEINFKMGKIYRYNLSDFNEAEKNYLITEKNEKNVIGLHRELASLYFVKGEYSKAVSYYQKATQEEPNDAELLFYQTLNLYNAKNIEQFLEYNALLLKKFSETQYPYLNYGTYYFNKKEQIKTIENFELAVQYGCNNISIIEYIINFYVAKNDSAKVKKYQSLAGK